MNNLYIDETIGYVRKIVENIQCAICDKIDGERLRYACGHTACDDCVIDAVDCQLCLTPPQVARPQPKLDDALTQRVKNTSELLKACQDLFNTDVFKHKRLSEQLRIEKELFPECIQAPVKYENKRKSSLSYKNKENRRTTFFPGEETSLSSENITMESSAKYVQQWLNKNDKDFTRKPFSDLNVNTQLDAKIKHSKRNYKQQTKENENISVLKINRKRSHIKTIDKSNPLQSTNVKSIITKPNGSSKKVKKELHLSNVNLVRSKTKTEHDNDESGVFMDDDPIVIDDSQETAIDKDKNAWLAVLEANEKEETESTSLVNFNLDHKSLIYTNKETLPQSNASQSKINPNMKVPFYKKSYIIETCTYCNAAPDKVVGQSGKVEITIDNANFTTKIEILKDVENYSKSNTTNSVSVQTVQTDTEKFPVDDFGFTNLKENHGKEDIVSQVSEILSDDLFEEEGQNIGIKYKQNNLHDCLVIPESDSDMEMEASGPLPVKVDVHRSCDESEYGILSEIVKNEEHNTRQGRGPRGLTPTSTDSSDKENYNPNRMKRHASKKKKYTKK